MYTCIECLTITIKPKQDNNIEVVNIHRRARVSFSNTVLLLFCPLLQKREKKNVIWVKSNTKSKLAAHSLNA